MPFIIHIWNYLISMWLALFCLCMVFLCDFPMIYHKNLRWEIVWFNSFHVWLWMAIYLIGILRIPYTSIVVNYKLLSYALHIEVDLAYRWNLPPSVILDTIKFGIPSWGRISRSSSSRPLLQLTLYILSRNSFASQTISLLLLKFIFLVLWSYGSWLSH